MESALWKHMICRDGHANVGFTAEKFQMSQVSIAFIAFSSAIAPALWSNFKLGILDSQKERQV